ncbi:MAG: hypothetical protein ACJAS1_004866 [Oleiphilaceae bacterium]|jgi:hypothetical protein
MMRKCLKLLLITCTCSTFADDVIEEPDLLSEEWPEEFFVDGSDEMLSGSVVVINESNHSILDFISVKLKGDLAYSDTLTLARGNLRVLSEGAALDNSYLKVDLQFNYFNAKDDLLLEGPSDEYTIKINDLWLQYSKNSCNVKLGRQGFFWGNVEGARAIDIVAPLDLTEPLLTDFSSIRRSQDIISANCFYKSFDVELFVLPKPLLDRYTARQTLQFEQLEDAFKAEWGGRITQHAQGLDLSFYYGRFFGNTPKPIIDLNALVPIGIYVEKFELVGAGLVYAIDRLLLELEMSYLKELAFYSEESISNYDYLLNKQLEERLELALGLEYTTTSNHMLSSGIWFYEYENDPLISSYLDTYVLNASWSKQFLNDDLSLSALVLWQKQPELYQLTFMAGLLMNDYWSTSVAITFQDINNDEIGSGISNELSDWVVQLSMIYQF